MVIMKEKRVMNTNGLRVLLLLSLALGYFLGRKTITAQTVRDR